VDTSRTTRCRPTAWSSLGSARKSSVALAPELVPPQSVASPQLAKDDATCEPLAAVCPIQHPWPSIPGPTSAFAPRPKVGAECVRGARSDLCGGRPQPTDEGPSLPRPQDRAFPSSRSRFPSHKPAGSASTATYPMDAGPRGFTRRSAEGKRARWRPSSATRTV
jgi:hypothetical protein